MLYEPLEDPEALPTHLPSPVQTLAWRAGDSFDIAALLASFLLGNGYDAYCVSGTAPKWITTRDTTGQPCPYEEPHFPEAEAPGADVTGIPVPGGGGGGAASSSSSKPSGGDASADGDGKASKYHPESRPPLESRYLAMMRERQEKEAAAAARAKDGRELVERARRDGGVETEEKGTPSRRDVDLLAGRRRHCWVLIRAGKRGVESHVFVEPTTGQVFPVDGSPYDGVESVWNHRNYWVNMQSPFLLPEVLVPVATRPATSLSRPPTRARTAGGHVASGGDREDDSLPPSHLARVHFQKARSGATTTTATGATLPTLSGIGSSALGATGACSCRRVVVSSCRRVW